MEVDMTGEEEEEEEVEVEEVEEVKEGKSGEGSDGLDCLETGLLELPFLLRGDERAAALLSGKTVV